MATQVIKFTPQMQLAFMQAVELSAAYNQALVRPEHVLLGMLQTPGCAAFAILRSLGVDIQLLAEKVTAAWGPRLTPEANRDQLMFDRGAQVSAEVNVIFGGAATDAR